MLNVKACSWSQLFCTATHTHTKEEEATENARQKTDTPEKNYIERLSSGKVYAVHLFVLVSSVKIFAYHNRKIVQKKYQRDRKKRTIHRKKKNRIIIHEQTFTLSVVCIPQKSQLNKMFENFIFAGAMNTRRCLSHFRFAAVAIVIIFCAPSTFLHELICSNRCHFPNNFTFLSFSFSIIIADILGYIFSHINTKNKLLEYEKRKNWDVM